MNYNKNRIVILFILGLATLLVCGYFVVSKTDELSEKESVSHNEGKEITEEDSPATKTQSLINEYYAKREASESAMIKKDLLGNMVKSDEFGIIDDIPIVDISLLLPKENWKEFSFEKTGLAVSYPTDGWYVQEKAGRLESLLVITTTESGEPEDENAFAKITIGEYVRDFNTTIFDWMRVSELLEGGIVPPTDRTTQYVKIGDNTFLGSVFFRENTWVGQKNVYAEVSSLNIFAASLEVENMYPDMKEVGVFDQVFYTILESLEVK